MTQKPQIFIYQTNPETRDRLAFGPFTKREANLVKPHCGGRYPRIVKARCPAYPCHDDGNILRRAAGLRIKKTAPL